MYRLTPRVLYWLLTSLAICGLLGGFVFSFAGDARAPGRVVTTSALPVSLAFCADRASATEPSEVMDCDFRANNPAPTTGQPDGARWVRLTVQVAHPQALGLRLYIGPHSLPRLTLFEKVQGRWSGQTAGSALPMNPRHAVVAGFRFATGPQLAGQATFFLQVEAPGLMHLRVVAEPMDAPELGLQAQAIGLGLQMGGLLLMTVVALGSALLRPDALMQRFAVYAATLVLCVLAGSGLLSIYFLGNQPRVAGWLFQWLLCLRLSVWIWLMNAFFQGWTTPPWYRRLCLGLQELVLVCLALVPLGGQVIVQALVLAGTAAFSVAQVAVLLRLRGMPPFFRRVLLGGFLVTDALIAGAVVATVYLAGTDLATQLVRTVDFATPLVLLLVIAFKRRLDQQEFVRVKGALQEESLRARFHQQAVQDRKMLIDMLTHELRNPLASISFAVGSLEDEWGGSQERPERRLRNIQRAIENMDSVIERCSLMNLMDQESAVVQRAPLDLSAFVLAFVKAHAGCARIDLELPPGGSPLNSDSQLLRIVLSNLLENAVKYSPPGSRIRLRLGRETQAGGQQVIVLSMTNAIAPGGAPDPGQVFERFYRHPLAQAQSGSGLGLYLVRAICRWLGGEVGYRRVSEQEVAFDLRLPA